MDFNGQQLNCLCCCMEDRCNRREDTRSGSYPPPPSQPHLFRELRVRSDRHSLGYKKRTSFDTTAKNKNQADFCQIHPRIIQEE